MSDVSDNLKLVRPMTQGELKTRDSIITTTLKVGAAFGALALIATPFRKSIGAWIAKGDTGFFAGHARSITEMFTGIRPNGIGGLNHSSAAVMSSVGLGAVTGLAVGVANHAVDRLRGTPPIGKHTQRLLDEQADSPTIQR